MDGSQEVAADPKEILHGAVHSEKPLRVRGGLKTPHLTLPLPGRLVRDFGPVVRVPVRAVDHGRHHGAAGREVAAEFVGDQSSGDTALAFQQLAEEPDGRPPIAPGLDQDVDTDNASRIGPRIGLRRNLETILSEKRTTWNPRRAAIPGQVAGRPQNHQKRCHPTAKTGDARTPVAPGRKATPVGSMRPCPATTDTTRPATPRRPH